MNTTPDPVHTVSTWQGFLGKLAGWTRGRISPASPFALCGVSLVLEDSDGDQNVGLDDLDPKPTGRPCRDCLAVAAGRACCSCGQKAADWIYWDACPPPPRWGRNPKDPDWAACHRCHTATTKHGEFLRSLRHERTGS
ncbi:MAG: hypothetical protein ACRCYU_17845 [Nocardioides sp.]